jgi:hypothetical protein
MTNCELINWPIPKPLRAEDRGNVMKFVARWQTGVETLSGFALQKLRLELAPPVSEPLTHFNA